MPVDYHLHTFRCGHASGTMEEYLDAARKAGFREIGFADHVPMYWLPASQRDPDTAMAMDQLPAYVQEVSSLRQQTADIKIRLGLEVDYIPGWEAQAAEMISLLPLDYVLGSIHFIDGWGFDNPAFIDRYSQWEAMALYQRYFQLLCRAANSGLFDVMAHPDLIKKFNYVPKGSLDDLYRQVAQAFAEGGVCAEINTAGLRVPAGEIYPAPTLLQYFYQYNVPVTLGSDAHTPHQVGEGIAQAIDLLKKVGYRQVVTFHRRQREYIDI